MKDGKFNRSTALLTENGYGRFGRQRESRLIAAMNSFLHRSRTEFQKTAGQKEGVR
jgi:hypothetical protein